MRLAITRSWIRVSSLLIAMMIQSRGASRSEPSWPKPAGDQMLVADCGTGKTRPRHLTPRTIGTLQSGVDRLAFEREHGEDAFMHPAQRFMGDEPLQTFSAQRELAEGEVALAPKTPLAKPVDVLRGIVLRAVDEAQVFPPTYFQGRLKQAFNTAPNEDPRLDHQPFAPPSGQLLPQPDPPGAGPLFPNC